MESRLRHHLPQCLPVPSASSWAGRLPRVSTAPMPPLSHQTSPGASNRLLPAGAPATCSPAGPVCPPGAADWACGRWPGRLGPTTPQPRISEAGIQPPRQGQLSPVSPGVIAAVASPWPVLLLPPTKATDGRQPVTHPGSADRQPRECPVRCWVGGGRANRLRPAPVTLSQWPSYQRSQSSALPSPPPSSRGPWPGTVRGMCVGLVGTGASELSATRGPGALSAQLNGPPLLYAAPVTPRSTGLAQPRFLPLKHPTHFRGLCSVACPS